MEWKGWIGKNVFLRTKSGKVYSGKIDGIIDLGDKNILVSVIDKYNFSVALAAAEISELKEELEVKK